MTRRQGHVTRPRVRVSGRVLGAVSGLVLLVALLGACETRDATSVEPVRVVSPRGLWISPEALSRLPTSGPAWSALEAEARRPLEVPDLADQDDADNVRVLAKALVAVRTGDAGLAEEVRAACLAVRGTERGATALAVGRELMTYVVAADLVGLPPADHVTFSEWLEGVRRRSFRGRTLRSTHEDRPNNWGTHAGATRLAIALFLRDEAEVLRSAHVFAGWLGEPEGWDGFDFGAGDWQPPGKRRFAVNPPKSQRDGHSIDGVLPDDQRRGGPFRWPPPKENYVYEALQGAVAQAVMLERQGFDAWSWGDRALLRAMRWLAEEADYPAQGDDTWIPHVVNRAYGVRFPAPVPSRPGKAMGFTDWTHGDGGDVERVNARRPQP